MKDVTKQENENGSFRKKVVSLAVCGMLAGVGFGALSAYRGGSTVMAAEEGEKKERADCGADGRTCNTRMCHGRSSRMKLSNGAACHALSNREQRPVGTRAAHISAQGGVPREGSQSRTRIGSHDIRRRYADSACRVVNRSIPALSPPALVRAPQ